MHLDCSSRLGFLLRRAGRRRASPHELKFIDRILIFLPHAYIADLAPFVLSYNTYLLSCLCGSVKPTGVCFVFSEFSARCELPIYLLCVPQTARRCLNYFPWCRLGLCPLSATFRVISYVLCTVVHGAWRHRTNSFRWSFGRRC